ncbi:MAG: SwmB domain-containing protein [Gaiellaceae bacterium]
MNSTTPTLTATFSDPDVTDQGKVTFQVCANSTCTAVGDPISSFNSTSTTLTNGQNGSAPVPGAAALTNGTTYFWRAQNVDTASRFSSFSSTRSFTVDTTAPTLSSATVATDGVTVTATWSESLDQTQAVPGSAFTVTPNGGASIAGTAAAVSYPAANQTRFVLASAVHHLDSLALAYTAPASDPKIRDTAQPTGNPAVNGNLANASITNNTTNAAPNIPPLVSPANAGTVTSTTPTLTATFSDPDTQDTGKITFQVCSDTLCTTPLGTFDSTSTTLANNQNGSGSVPSGYGLANTITYYWRAKNTDSSSTASSFSAIRSFTVQTDAAPNVPTLVTPLNAAIFNTSTPTLTATFSDPDAPDTGTIGFKICGNATCTAGGDPLSTFSSASAIVNGQNGSAPIPSGLADGTYFWFADATDNHGLSSAYSSGRSLTIDTTAPTNVFSLTGVSLVGGLPVAYFPGSGSTIYYNGSAGTGAQSFKIRATVTDATTGGASITTQSFLNGGSNTSHTDATTTTPGSGVFDTNPFSFTPVTTGNPTVSVFTTDGASNNSATTNFTVQNDALAPTAAVTFPTAARYNSTGWTGSITGTAADSGAGVSTVKVAIHDNTAGNDYNGTSFGAGGQQFQAASGTTSWSYALAAAALTNGDNYTITVETIDNVGNTSTSAATQSFTYDTTAPTVSSRSVNGSTLDVTYSEPLNTSSAPAGTDFAVKLNGVSDTVTGVSFPSSTVVRLALTTAARHADTTTVAYSGTAIQDPAGNAAATYTAQTATDNTPDVAPNTPVLGAPGNGVFINSTTPTLNATFSDPDTQDTGKITFEVCTTNTCSGSSLGTFDSTTTTLAVGASGSAAVPGTFNLASGTTYFWRAKNVDSSNNSSAFSSTQSFTVDTSAPVVAIAAPTAGTNPGAQFYDSIGNVLWLNANQTGTFQLNATASDAQSGIASVAFPAFFGGGGGTNTGGSNYQSAAYTFPGGGFASPGSKNVTATNNVTVPSAMTSTAPITISADGTGPTVGALGNGSLNGEKVSTGVLLTTAASDAGSGVKQVSYFYCDRTANSLCTPSIPAGSSTSSGTNFQVGWNNTGLTDGDSYAVMATATDNVGNTTDSAIATVLVDNSPPVVTVTTPTKVGSPGQQFWNAGSKTLFVQSGGSATFKLEATATDAQSGIASVAFPTVFGGGAGNGTNTGGSNYESSLYSVGGQTSSPGSETITGSNGVNGGTVHPLTASDSLTVTADGTAPVDSVQFPTSNGAYDSTNNPWNSASSSTCSPPLSGGHICGTVSDAGAGVASVTLTLENTDTAKWYDGTGFNSSTSVNLTATLSGTQWSYALDQSALPNQTHFHLTVQAQDNVANAEPVQTIDFTNGVDTTPPDTALTIPGASHAFITQVGTHALPHSGRDYNLYYNGNLAGGFTLHAVSTDLTGVGTIAFPALAPFAGSLSSPSGGGSTSFTTNSSPYTFAAGASAPPQAAVKSTDTSAQANWGNDTLTFLADSTAPAGGALTVNGIPATGAGATAYLTTTSVSIGTRTDYTDEVAGSGLASSTLTMSAATLSNGTCGTPGSPTTITGTDLSGVSFASGNCYTFTLTGTDNVGNAASVSETLKVDTTAPTAPTVGFTGLSSGNTFDNGAGTLFFRPSAGGAAKITASGAADAESGIKTGNNGYTFSPALTGNVTGTQTGNQLAIAFDGSSSGSNTYSIVANDNAGLSSAAANFTLTADSTAPAGGALTVNGTAAAGAGTTSYLSSGTTIAIGVRTDYADAGSGLHDSTLSMTQEALANNVCGAAQSTSTISGTQSQNVTDGRCYVFTLTGTDNVGNQASLSTTVIVDTTPPSQPSISFGGLSAGNTFVNGSTLFFRPSASGTFTVNANGASDAETGIGGYTFSNLNANGGSFASVTPSGNTLAVAFDGSSAGPTAGQTVTANNNAGLSSTPGAFTITQDSTAPVGGGISASPFSSSPTIALSETDFNDGTGSGVASLALTRSDPQAPVNGGCPVSGWTGATPVTLTNHAASDTVPTDGMCYQYTLTATDNVGNVARTSTNVLVDSTPPAGGSVSYADGLSSLAAVSVGWDKGSDAQSGISQVLIEKASATLTGSTCGSFSGFTVIATNPGSSPIGDTAVAAGNCYVYEVVVTNGAGLTATYTSTAVVHETAASPIALSGSPAGSFLAGSTLYLAGSGGSFQLQLTTIGQNGVASATWQGKGANPPFSSSPATDSTVTAAPYQSGTYTWTPAFAGGASIQVTRHAGGTTTTDSVGVQSDTSAPTGSISYADGMYQSASVPVTVSSSDGDGSGIATTQVQRASTTLSGSTCDTGHWSGFSPVTLSGGVDNTVLGGNCYMYQAVVTDNVGNQATIASANAAKIPDVTPPTFVSATTGTNQGQHLTINMSETLDCTATTPAGAFAVNFNGIAQPAPTAIQCSGSQIVLTLGTLPNNSQVVRVSYTKPAAAGDQMRDIAVPTENPTASFVNALVTNNTPDTVAPALTSAAINAGTLTLNFDEALAGVAPDGSAFTVSADGNQIAVTGVLLSGQTVTLSLASAVTSSQHVTVNYDIPARGALHDAAANDVAAFAVAASNQTPFTPPPPTNPGPPPTTVPAPSLASASPADGDTVLQASSISLSANEPVDWSGVTLTRPDGSTQALDARSGTSETWSIAGGGNGLYTIAGTIAAGGQSQSFVTHFTFYVPPAAGGGQPPPPRRPCRRRRRRRSPTP